MVKTVFLSGRNFVVFSTLLLSSIACSSGSSDGPSELSNSDFDSSELNNDAQSATTSASFTLLPVDSDEPNTVAPDIVVDANGRYHSAYADIQGRLLYALCNNDCEDSSQWSVLQLTQFDINSLTGSITPKLILDDAQQLHLAASVSFGGGGIFSTQQIHYASCFSDCINAGSWTLGLAVSLNRSVLQINAQSRDWFGLTPDNEPRFGFIEPVSALGDEFLWYFSCEAACSTSDNWIRTQVAELSIASSKPADLLIGSDGKPRLISPYQKVGSDLISLQYWECLFDCDSATPTWSEPVEIVQITQSILQRDEYSVTLVEDQPMIAVFSDSGQLDVNLFLCPETCVNLLNWERSNVGDALPVPASVSQLSSIIDITSNAGLLHLGLIGKDRSINSANRVMRFTCADTCSTNQWTYAALADTSVLAFDNQGICLFLGTAATGPLKLVPGAFSFGVSPMWGCSTSAVEVTDADGNVYIDNSADIRFFEIASFGISN